MRCRCLRFACALLAACAAGLTREARERKYGDPCKSRLMWLTQNRTSKPAAARAEMQALCEGLPHVEHQRHPRYKQGNMDVIPEAEDWIEAQEDGRSNLYDVQYKHRVLGELLARAIATALPSYRRHVPSMRLSPLAMRRAAAANVLREWDSRGVGDPGGHPRSGSLRSRLRKQTELIARPGAAQLACRPSVLLYDISEVGRVRAFCFAERSLFKDSHTGV